MRLALTGVLAALALLGISTEAQARRGDVVPCGTQYGWTTKIKPRSCNLASGRYGYQQLNVVKIHWRSWGGATAYGRGTVAENMGFRAPVRFKLHRSRPFEFGFNVYTRASGTTFSPYSGPIRWRNKNLLP